MILAVTLAQSVVAERAHIGLDGGDAFVGVPRVVLRPPGFPPPVHPPALGFIEPTSTGTGSDWRPSFAPWAMR